MDYYGRANEHLSPPYPRSDEMRNYRPEGLPDQPDSRFAHSAKLSVLRRRPFLTAALIVAVVIAFFVLVLLRVDAGPYVDY